MHQLLKESANLRFFVNQMYLVDPMSFIAVLVFVAHEFMIVGVNVVDYFLPDKFFVREIAYKMSAMYVAIVPAVLLSKFFCIIVKCCAGNCLSVIFIEI